MIVRGGTNNGAWFHYRAHLWVQNEDTDKLARSGRSPLVRRIAQGRLAPARSRPQPRWPPCSARPGFTVELVAAEPLVTDPIAFAWGPDGKLWVVEMGDYPLGLDGKGKPGGQVRCLRRHRRRRPLRQVDRVPRRPGLSHRRGPLAQRRARVAALPTFSTPKTPTATARPTCENPLHRLHPGQPAASRQRTEVGPRRLAVLRQRRQRRQIKSRQDRARKPRSAAAISAFGPTQGLSIRSRASRNSAAIATTGATGSAATTAIRCISSCSTTITLRRNPHVPHAGRSRRLFPSTRAAPVFPRSRTLARFNDLHTAPIASRRPIARSSIATICSARCSPATPSSASRCTIWCIAR